MAYPFESDVHIKKFFKLLFGNYASKIWDDEGNLTVEAPDGLVEIISANGLYVNGVQVVPGAGGTSHRELLSSARTYYVRTDGNDANTGLTNTSGGAFKTIQKAVDIVCSKLDMSDYGVIIQVADGTHSYASTAALLRPYVGRIAPVIVGNTTTPASCVLSVAGHAIRSDGGLWYVRGFKLTTTNNGIGIVAENGGIIRISNMEFGVCAGQHMYAKNATIMIDSAYTVSGSCLHHIVAEHKGLVTNNGIGFAVTFSGTPDIGVFFLAQARGTILYGGNTYVSTATGIRYSVTEGSFVRGGTGTSYGNVAGSIATDGYFTT